MARPFWKLLPPHLATHLRDHGVQTVDDFVEVRQYQREKEAELEAENEADGMNWATVPCDECVTIEKIVVDWGRLDIWSRIRPNWEQEIANV